MKNILQIITVVEFQILMFLLLTFVILQYLKDFSWYEYGIKMYNNSTLF